MSKQKNKTNTTRKKMRRIENKRIKRREKRKVLLSSVVCHTKPRCNVHNAPFLL